MNEAVGVAEGGAGVAVVVGSRVPVRVGVRLGVRDGVEVRWMVKARVVVGLARPPVVTDGEGDAAVVDVEGVAVGVAVSVGVEVAVGVLDAVGVEVK